MMFSLICIICQNYVAVTMDNEFKVMRLMFSFLLRRAIEGFQTGLRI